jgi:hypothetical protein
MPDLSRVDLTQVAAGGLSLVASVWVVYQVLKRKYSIVAHWVPLLIIATVLAMVVSLIWAPVVFIILAGTFIGSALVFTVHAVGGKVGSKQPPDKTL